MENRIAELAKQMGVSIADVRCLAQSVANSITHDKADKIYLKSDASTQTELAQAYLPVAVKKFNQFQSKLMTCHEAKTTFQNRILSELKA